MTSAGQGHLEGFGGVAGVIREKLSLTIDAPLAIVGTEPADLRPGARALARRVVTAGLGQADVMPTAVRLLPDGRPEVSIDGRQFTLAARGLHQAGNAMFAWAIAREYGLDLDACAMALERFTLPAGRGELTQHGALTILNDSYNANPQSFATVISLVRTIRDRQRLVFVAGTMRELGNHSVALHAEVAGQLAALDPDLLVLVGEFVDAFAPYRARFGGRLLEGPDAESVAAPLAAQPARRRIAGPQGVARRCARTYSSGDPGTPRSLDLRPDALLRCSRRSGRSSSSSTSSATSRSGPPGRWSRPC